MSVLASALLSLAAVAQTPAKPASLAAPALDAARTALAAGDTPGAMRHALTAFEVEPRSREALELLLEIARGDTDARVLWSHEYVASLADAKGRIKLERKTAEAFPANDTSAVDLAAARAAATDELAGLAASARKAADKDLESVLVAHWAAEVGRELVHGSPALTDAFADAFPAPFVLSNAARRATVDALERKLGSASASGDHATAVELALVLRGLAAQAGFQDLQGPKPPDLSKALDAAANALAKARALLATNSGEPWTVETLEALDGDQAERFTREHASFASPGVALSPAKRYRLETICGHATLLGATQTVEQHHQRLVNWYGTDPFENEPGLVRLVPESAGLESEGSPFFWAGGFQSGNVTTLRMACGTIEGLGRGLTHELTHRFDGALFPGMPAWLAEGRAVWTGAAYANIDDEQFVLDHALFGTIDDARYRGYGGRDELERLVSGTIEDYRDNYVAGYALYVYLASWYEKEGEPLFAAALAKYLKSRRGDRREPFDAFCEHFCDGKEGRPKDFEAFAQGFGTFVSGFYWRDRKPFTKRYRESAGDTRGSGLVLDEPTWVWSRARAEPWFGQDQARAAGELLRRLGDEPGAMAAFTWSLAVDERWTSVDSALRELFAGASKREGAWVLARDLEQREVAQAKPAGPAPMLARTGKLRAFLDAQRAAVAKCASAGAPRAAAALAADHDRLARLVGLPSLASTLPAPDLAAPLLHPFDEPRRSLVPSGFLEDGLTDYERHRARGAWCVDERLQLHIGRSTPRSGTGTTDRTIHTRDAFARSTVWLDPGRYRLRARIAPTTSFVSGAIVAGYERRDRNARFHFSAGDYSYAIGDKDEPAELTTVSWSLRGLYEREGGLPGAQRGGEHAFGRTVSAFEVELVIDGGALHAFVDGAYMGAIHTPDGEPIEGYVGFASSIGAYKVSALSVQRLDRSAAFADLAGVPGPIALDRPRTAAFREALGRRLLGIPRDRRGTLVAWSPMPELDDQGAFDVERAVERILERAMLFERLVTRQAIASPVCLAVPAALGDETLARVKRELDAKLLEEFGKRLVLVRHGATTLEAERAARERGLASDSHQAHLLFVDSAGVLRAAEGLHAGKAIEGALERWIDVFRNR